jgi:glycosyltransferase involved in cell wall biosynthesis
VSQARQEIAQAAGAMEPESLELSVLMPCLNESETLATCIEKARGSLIQHGIAGEIIVADNGSSDGSQAIATRLGARVVPVEARGYGAALMGGIRAARGRFVIMADADDSYDFSNLMPFVAKLREGYQLVMGNRFKGGILPGAMPPLHRYLGNPVLTGLGRLFFRAPCGDFHCGMRGFQRDAALAMDLQSTGMEFASEMVVKATLLGMRISEVPTTLAPDGRSRRPHLRTWRDGWRHLRFLMLFSPRWLFLYPGALLMLLGILAGAWILPGPRRVGGVVLDVHTLTYAAAAVLIGFQSIAFAVFTKVFAITEGLLPEDPRMNRIFSVVTLEVGLVVGVAFLIAGLIASIWALSSWGSHSFGTLDPSQMLRVIIPGALALALGCQIILTSFFLSVLGLGRQRGQGRERSAAR